MQFTRLLPLYYSSCFLYTSEQLAQGGPYPQLVGHSPINHLLKYSYRVADIPIIWKYFLKQCSLMKNDFCFCHTGTELSRTAIYTLSSYEGKRTKTFNRNTTFTNIEKQIHSKSQIKNAENMTR